MREFRNPAEQSAQYLPYLPERDPAHVTYHYMGGMTGSDNAFPSGHYPASLQGPPANTGNSFESQHLSQLPGHLTFRFEGAVYHAMRQFEGPLEFAGVIDVERVQAKKVRRGNHRK